MLRNTHVEANPQMKIRYFPDVTAAWMPRHSLEDIASLLTKIEHNRLVDAFMGMPCISLLGQSSAYRWQHTAVPCDDVYVGLASDGSARVFPLRAAVSPEQIAFIDAESDLAWCRRTFPGVACTPIGGYVIDLDVITMFAFEPGENGMCLLREKHYGMIEPENTPLPLKEPSVA